MASWFRLAPSPRASLIVALLLAIFGASAAAFADDDDDDDDGQEIVPDQILAELVPGASERAVADRYGLTILDGLPSELLWLYGTPAGSDTEALAERMELDPDVDEAEAHFRLDTPEGGQRTIPDLDRNVTIDDVTNQPALGTIGASAAQEIHRGRGVVVGVLDSGVSYEHELVSGFLLSSDKDLVDDSGRPIAQANGVDDDGDGLVDEGLHHGTFVSGVVKLSAPGARVYPIRVLDDEGRGTVFRIARGLRDAAANGVDVINLSLGLTSTSDLLGDAIADVVDQGVVVVAASGNRGSEPADVPARLEGVIAVGAVDELGARATFSSYGSGVDLAAPGIDVLSSYGDADEYGRWSGTSFSAPMVTGAVALLRERYPGLPPASVRAALRDTASPHTNVSPGELGTGVLDLEAIARVVLPYRNSLRVTMSGPGFESVASLSPVEFVDAHDMVRGDVASLSSHPNGHVDLGGVICHAEDLPTDPLKIDSAPDAELPSPGRAFFYVARDAGPGVTTTAYGTDSSGRERRASGTECTTAP
jgi:subtilisin family serine protease